MQVKLIGNTFIKIEQAGYLTKWQKFICKLFKIPAEKRVSHEIRFHVNPEYKLIPLDSTIKITSGENFRVIKSDANGHVVAISIQQLPYKHITIGVSVVIIQQSSAESSLEPSANKAI